MKGRGIESVGGIKRDNRGPVAKDPELVKLVHE